MEEVIFGNFKDKGSWECGPALCPCGGYWIAVSPVGIERLECPRCHEMTGKRDTVTPCECGNTQFFIGTTGNVYCSDCHTKRGVIKDEHDNVQDFSTTHPNGLRTDQDS